jgi:uncharacterized protein YlxP (DUF503 family)
VFVGALRLELMVEHSTSLKAKRSVVRHIVEVARRRFGVSASEVAFQDQWQRCALGFSVVAPSAGHVEEVLDKVERFVWSNPEVTVHSAARHWLEVDA